MSAYLSVLNMFSSFWNSKGCDASDRPESISGPHSFLLGAAWKMATDLLPDLCSDGCPARCDASGACFAVSSRAFTDRCWCEVQDVRSTEGDTTRILCAVPGVLRIVQRAKLWGALLALQALSPVFAGVDHLNVVRACC